MPVTQSQPTPRPAQAAPKQQQSTNQELSTELETLSVSSRPATSGSNARSATQHWPICENKGAGRVGRSVRIETNYLALNVSNIKNRAYHYDIVIEPDKPKRLLKAVFNKFRETNFPEIAIAYDGQKNAYAPVMLDFERPITRETQIVDDETSQQRTYMVSIKEVRDSEINLSCLKK